MEGVGIEISAGWFVGKWNFTTNSCLSNNLGARQQGIELVNHVFEACGVAFTDGLFAQSFKPAFAFINDYTKGFSRQCLKLFQIAGKKNGPKVGDIPFSRGIRNNDVVVGK